MRNALNVLATTALLGLAACGQDPSFLEREGTAKDADAKAAGTGGSIDDGATSANGADPNDPNSTGQNAPGSEGDVSLPGEGGNDWTPGWAGGDTTGDESGNDSTNDGGSGGGTGGGTGGTGGTTTPMPAIPGADDDDLPALHHCLAAWKNNPFKGTVNNFDHIYASVSVGGSGNVINDTERTSEPYLILVDAGVNVGGTPTYNLMNPNGYYCIKVNVNVLTTLNVNLHCNARLADDKVNVNVGSTQDDTTSAVGVHVLSQVHVNTVRPQGDSCIR